MDLEKYIAYFKNLSAVAAVYLFGSQTKSPRPYSDLDLCVITELPVSPEVKSQIMSSAGRKIDLHLFQDLPLPLQFQVIKEGKLLFCRNQEYLNEIRFQTIRKYQDFQPTLKRHKERVLK